MKKIAQNIFAVLAGVFIGSLVNISIVNLGPLIVPLPKGADVSSMDGLRESMSLFTPANFICPFLGHALGTLAGAYTAAMLAASYPARFAYGLALYFLAGGIAMIFMLGGPLWFVIADLLIAYIPMGYLGARLADRHRFRTSEDQPRVV